MSPALKNAILLIVLLIVVGAAAWFFYRGDPERGYSTDVKTTGTEWMCTKCGWRVTLSSKEVNDWQNDPAKVLRKPGLKQSIFHCPQCNDFLVTRAEHCDRHDVWYCVRDTQGNYRNCPECEKQMAAGQ